MKGSETDHPPGGFLRPFLTVMGLSPLHISTGAVLAQSAGMLPQLMREDSLIPIDMNQATWIASMSTIGTVVAGGMSGPLADIFGRIRVVQMSLFLSVLGYGTIAAANSYMMIMTGRFLIGLGVGFSCANSVFMSEISPPAYRGFFLNLCPGIASVGLVYMYIIGGYFPWNIGAGVTCVIAIIGLIVTLTFYYDSPIWLVRQNRLDEARKSLCRVEGPENVDAKLKQLQLITDKNPETSFNFRSLTHPTIWKPYLMTLALSALQNASGFYIIISYTVHFMREFHTGYDPLQIMVAIGLVRMMGVVVSFPLFRTVGRKTIGTFSGFSSAACLLLIYVCLKAPSLPILQNNPWLPILIFLMYVFTMTLGIYPLPWTMPYELYPTKVRGTMSGITFCSMYGLVFMVVKAYNVILGALHLEGMILLFMVGSLLFGLLSATVLLETHRKTLEEIEQLLSGKRGEQADNES